MGSVQWLTSKGSPTSSHNIYFPFLDLSQHHKCKANRVGHLLLQFGSALLFPMLTVLCVSPCPALCALLWASRGNLVRNKPTGAKETSMSFCLALGQQAQMEMNLSPVVKTELSMPIHANAASLQNPAKTQGSLTFPTTLSWFPLTPCPPSQPIPQYTVMLSLKLYKTVHRGSQCLY